MLEVRRISVRYGAIEALADVSLQVARGSWVAILGANGGGKSTLLRTISSLLRPVSGDIVLDGASLVSKPPEEVVRLGVAHVPEGRGIFPDLTVRENLMIGAYSRPDRADVAEACADVLRAFPALHKREHQRGSTLSGGEQQMLAIGRALMSRPRMLLADEVSLGLAPVVISQLFAELAKLRERGVTIVTVEQNAKLAMRFADYVYVLKQGRMVLEGSSRDLSGSSELTEAYLGV
jgi:branched-chain amino acid transport system ATP-binding protein